MKPLDPQLLRRARPALTYVVLVCGTGLVQAGLIIAQCFLIAYAAAPVITGDAGWGDVDHLVVALAGVFLARSLITRLELGLGHRAALATIATLREAVLDRAAKLGPRWRAERTSSVVTLSSRGLDDLEPYFVNYIPQLFLCVTVTPITLAVVLILDWLSAFILILCIPLIPLFMIIIGKMTAHHSAKKLAAMEALGDQVLDLIAGLPTLKGLGREQGPKQRVKELGTRYTNATMSTLRVAFLSGTTLEFFATLSTALVAVEVGFRMVYGYLSLPVGLLIIMLTPEIFKPLREVGSQFHASADGVAAFEQALEILDTPLPSDGHQPAPSPADHPIVVSDLSIEAPGRGTMAPANLTGSIEPGKVTVLVGPNGSGKSSTVSAILGILSPTSGTITIDGRPISELDPTSWWSMISWVPQRPTIVPGTIAENIGVDDPEEAGRLTGLSAIVGSLPDGWETRIGQGGIGLSVGQRQRLALTRALCDTRPLVVLDEPTAHLDAASEQEIIDTVCAIRDSGKTVVIIAHRSTLTRIADHTITVSSEVTHDSHLR